MRFSCRLHSRHGGCNAADEQRRKYELVLLPADTKGQRPSPPCYLLLLAAVQPDGHARQHPRRCPEQLGQRRLQGLAGGADVVSSLRHHPGPHPAVR